MSAGKTIFPSGGRRVRHICSVGVRSKLNLVSSGSRRARRICPLRVQTFFKHSYPVIAEGLAGLGSIERLEQPPFADGRCGIESLSQARRRTFIRPRTRARASIPRSLSARANSAWQPSRVRRLTNSCYAPDASLKTERSGLAARQLTTARA